MKSIFFISSFIFSVLIGTSQGTDTLTNGNIIKLHKAGFSKEILKSKILSSSAKFDVSINRCEFFHTLRFERDCFYQNQQASAE